VTWPRAGARQQVPVPAQHRVRPDQQPEPAEDIRREPVQQRPVAGQQARPGLTKLPLQDHDLVAKHQDPGILIPVARRKQPQQREHARHAPIDQSKQHSRPSWRSKRG